MEKWKEVKMYECPHCVNLSYIPDPHCQECRESVKGIESPTQTRIRELEEVVEGMLYEVKRTISPELREKAENVLNKTEKEVHCCGNPATGLHGEPKQR